MLPPQRLLLLLSFAIALSNAHICMFEPRMRGNISIAVPGDPACYVRHGQCGDTVAGTPVITYDTGVEVEVSFQQNLNHWYPPKPGHFDVSISSVLNNPQDSDFTVLQTFSDYPAHDMVTQTNITIGGIYFKEPCAHCVLRLRYVSNNPMEIDPANNTNAIFYQCADIAIRGPAIKTPLPPSPSPLPPTVKGDCVAPPSWSVSGYGSTVSGAFTQHVYYSKSQNFVRWDRKGQWRNRHQADDVSLYTNYTTEREYIYDRLADSCVVYGPDAWYDWSWGSTDAMTLVSATDTKNTYALNGDTMRQFTWIAEPQPDGTCLPNLRQSRDTLLIFNTEEAVVGPIDPSVFQLPAACHKSRVRVGGCRQLTM